MKTLYLECAMGAAGDMLFAALLELHPDPAQFLRRMNALPLPGVSISAEKCEKCGVMGTHVRVEIGGAEEESSDVAHTHTQEHSPTHAPVHSHTGLREVRHVISHLDLPEQVRCDALSVYESIAQAESAVHGKPVDQIHFHEVGALDAVADVVGVCLLLHELAPERIAASPIHVGSGQVRCAHGILPVPAPATARLLQGIPIYGGGVLGELCTPTGAALLRHFVQEFGPMLPMTVAHIGYGMGTKEFEQANCVRAMLGTTAQRQSDVLELRCNLDDMTPEAVAFAAQQILDGGALDVFTVPIQMKKNRPGVLLTCLCRPAQREEMLRLLFEHTTTLGVRETLCARSELARSTETVQTTYGPVRVKTSSGWGVRRRKAEYDDVAKIALAQGISFADALRLLPENSIE